MEERDFLEAEAVNDTDLYWNLVPNKDKEADKNVKGEGEKKSKIKNQKKENLNFFFPPPFMNPPSLSFPLAL